MKHMLLREILPSSEITHFVASMAYADTSSVSPSLVYFSAQD